MQCYNHIRNLENISKYLFTMCLLQAGQGNGWDIRTSSCLSISRLCLNKGIANWNRDIPQSSVLITDLANIVSCSHISSTEDPAHFFPQTFSFLLKASLRIHLKKWRSLKFEAAILMSRPQRKGIVKSTSSNLPWRMEDYYQNPSKQKTNSRFRCESKVVGRRMANIRDSCTRTFLFSCNKRYLI